MTSPRFRFPLARLLSLRERRERDAAMALAAARGAEDALQRTRDQITTRRADARDAMLPADGQTKGVSELFNMAFLLEQLDKNIVATNDALRTAALDATRCHTHLNERVRERRTLERLRDRQLAEWRALADRRDREEMDAIGQTRAASNSFVPTGDAA